MSEDAKLCFVVGPIGELDSETRIHADWLLEEIIQPVFSARSDFSVVRADKISLPGMIDAQVIKHLIDADVVVADLSTLNPNAFYEIGIRHMVQKPIIHMQLAEDKIPFDVSLYRAIKFSRTRPSDVRRARQDLTVALESVMAPEYKTDNPVTRARGQISLDLQASPSERVLSNQMKAIQQRLLSLEILAESGKADLELNDRDFVRGALTIDHAPMLPNGKNVSELHSRLIALFGEKIRAIQTSGGKTKADINVSSLTYEESEAYEKQIASFAGVRNVALIPF